MHLQWNGNSPFPVNGNNSLSVWSSYFNCDIWATISFNSSLVVCATDAIFVNTLPINRMERIVCIYLCLELFGQFVLVTTSLIDYLCQYDWQSFLNRIICKTPGINGIEQRATMMINDATHRTVFPCQRTSYIWPTMVHWPAWARQLYCIFYQNHSFLKFCTRELPPNSIVRRKKIYFTLVACVPQWMCTLRCRELITQSSIGRYRIHRRGRLLWCFRDYCTTAWFVQCSLSQSHWNSCLHWRVMCSACGDLCSANNLTLTHRTIAIHVMLTACMHIVALTYLFFLFLFWLCGTAHVNIERRVFYSST